MFVFPRFRFRRGYNQSYLVWENPWHITTPRAADCFFPVSTWDAWGMTHLSKIELCPERRSVQLETPIAGENKQKKRWIRAALDTEPSAGLFKNDWWRKGKCGSHKGCHPLNIPHLFPLQHCRERTHTNTFLKKNDSRMWLFKFHFHSITQLDDAALLASYGLILMTDKVKLKLL